MDEKKIILLLAGVFIFVLGVFLFFSQSNTFELATSTAYNIISSVQTQNHA